MLDSVHAMAVAALCPLAIASAAPVLARAAATPPPPPSLLTLEQKMGELKISSLRFSLQKSVTVPLDEHEVLRFLKLFGLDSRASGEVTIAPAAANVTLGFFGHPLTFRASGKTVYGYFAKLARYDDGRPWVRLGPDGLSELFTVNGHRVRPRSKASEPRPAEPKLAEPPFAVLAKTLANAREVRELGPGIVDSQAVTRYLAVLEPSQLKSQALASVSRLVPAPQLPTATLEVSLAADGLPVLTVITVHNAGMTTSIRLEIPAVNFPLVIRATSGADHQRCAVEKARKTGA